MIHSSGIRHITYFQDLFQDLLIYITTLSAFQWGGFIAAGGAVVWCVWWARQPDG